jgi:CobQ-like glutamine amidotransferase family enzyme
MALRLSEEEKAKVLEIIDSGEPFLIIAGSSMGHTYYPHTQSWRETLGLLEVMRTVIRQKYKRGNKKLMKKAEKEERKARKKVDNPPKV